METKSTLVRVKQGDLRGVIEDGVYGGQYLAFRGIPYAKAPVGELRFKDPEPGEPWSGIRDASEFGNVCTHLDILRREVIGSEDCLFLNVYTPVNKGSTKLPVMVWIHGGAFIYGSGNDFYYGPDYLIQKDVVLVTINYRLGVLGFLNLEHEVAPGNQGLKDQVMALKWVQENISNFGGDPSNVTIFGESAGSASVHYLTLSSLAQGLFHKAICQSGVATNPWAHITIDPTSYAYRFVQSLGNNSSDPESVVKFLRTVDATKLVATQSEFISKEDQLKLFGAFGPGIDYASPNPFLPQHPSVAMQAGVQVPLLLGFNANEGSLILNIFHKGPVKNLYEKVDANFELIVYPEIMEALEKDGITANDLKYFYFGNEKITEETAGSYAQFLSDMMFLRGIYEVVNVQTEKGSHPTYFYEFTYDDENSVLKKMFNITLPGATHAQELGYIFFPHALQEFNMGPPSTDSMEYTVIQYFTEMWTNFAKTGNPTPAKTDLISTIWEPLKKGNVYDLMDIGEKLQMKSTKKGTQSFEWNKRKNKL